MEKELERSCLRYTLTQKVCTKKKAISDLPDFYFFGEVVEL